MFSKRYVVFVLSFNLLINVIKSEKEEDEKIKELNGKYKILSIELTVARNHICDEITIDGEINLNENTMNKLEACDNQMFNSYQTENGTDVTQICKRKVVEGETDVKKNFKLLFCDINEDNKRNKKVNEFFECTDELIANEGVSKKRIEFSEYIEYMTQGLICIKDALNIDQNTNMSQVYGTETYIINRKKADRNLSCNLRFLGSKDDSILTDFGKCYENILKSTRSDSFTINDLTDPNKVERTIFEYELMKSNYWATNADPEKYGQITKKEYYNKHYKSDLEPLINCQKTALKLTNDENDKWEECIKIK